MVDPSTAMALTSPPPRAFQPLAIRPDLFNSEAFELYSPFFSGILRFLFGTHVENTPSELAVLYVPADEIFHSHKRPPAGSVPSVFHAMWTNDPKSSKLRIVIADLVGMKKSTVHPDLQELIGFGLVIETGKRPIYYALTETARVLGDEIDQMLKNYEDHAALTEKDRSEITAWLRERGIVGPGLKTAAKQPTVRNPARENPTSSSLSPEMKEAKEALGKKQEQIHNQRAIINDLVMEVSNLRNAVRTKLKNKINELKTALIKLEDLTVPKQLLHKTMASFQAELDAAQSSLENESLLEVYDERIGKAVQAQLAAEQLLLSQLNEATQFQQFIDVLQGVRGGTTLPVTAAKHARSARAEKPAKPAAPQAAAVVTPPTEVEKVLEPAAIPAVGGAPDSIQRILDDPQGRSYPFLMKYRAVAMDVIAKQGPENLNQGTLGAACIPKITGSAVGQSFKFYSIDWEDFLIWVLNKPPVPESIANALQDAGFGPTLRLYSQKALQMTLSGQPLNQGTLGAYFNKSAGAMSAILRTHGVSWSDFQTWVNTLVKEVEAMVSSMSERSKIVSGWAALERRVIPRATPPETAEVTVTAREEVKPIPAAPAAPVSIAKAIQLLLKDPKVRPTLMRYGLAAAKIIAREDDLTQASLGEELGLSASAIGAFLKSHKRRIITWDEFVIWAHTLPPPRTPEERQELLLHDILGRPSRLEDRKLIKEFPIGILESLWMIVQREGVSFEGELQSFLGIYHSLDRYARIRLDKHLTQLAQESDGHSIGDLVERLYAVYVKVKAAEQQPPTVPDSIARVLKNEEARDTLVKYGLKAQEMILTGERLNASRLGVALGLSTSVFGKFQKYYHFEWDDFVTWVNLWSPEAGLVIPSGVTLPTTVVGPATAVQVARPSKPVTPKVTIAASIARTLEKPGPRKTLMEYGNAALKLRAERKTLTQSAISFAAGRTSSSSFSVFLVDRKIYWNDFISWIDQGMPTEGTVVPDRRTPAAPSAPAVVAPAPTTTVPTPAAPAVVAPVPTTIARALQHKDIKERLVVYALLFQPLKKKTQKALADATSLKLWKIPYFFDSNEIDWEEFIAWAPTVTSAMLSPEPAEPARVVPATASGAGASAAAVIQRPAEPEPAPAMKKEKMSILVQRLKRGHAEWVFDNADLVILQHRSYKAQRALIREITHGDDLMVKDPGELVKLLIAVYSDIDPQIPAYSRWPNLRAIYDYAHELETEAGKLERYAEIEPFVMSLYQKTIQKPEYQPYRKGAPTTAETPASEAVVLRPVIETPVEQVSETITSAAPAAGVETKEAVPPTTYEQHLEFARVRFHTAVRDIQLARASLGSHDVEAAKKSLSLARENASAALDGVKQGDVMIHPSLSAVVIAALDTHPDIAQKADNLEAILKTVVMKYIDYLEEALELKDESVISTVHAVEPVEPPSVWLAALEAAQELAVNEVVDAAELIKRGNMTAGIAKATNVRARLFSIGNGFQRLVESALETDPSTAREALQALTSAQGYLKTQIDSTLVEAESNRTLSPIPAEEKAEKTNGNDIKEKLVRRINQAIELEFKAFPVRLSIDELNQRMTSPDFTKVMTSGENELRASIVRAGPSTKKAYSHKNARAERDNSQRLNRFMVYAIRKHLDIHALFLAYSNYDAGSIPLFRQPAIPEVRDSVKLRTFIADCKIFGLNPRKPIRQKDIFTTWEHMSKLKKAQGTPEHEALNRLLSNYYKGVRPTARSESIARIPNRYLQGVANALTFAWVDEVVHLIATYGWRDGLREIWNQAWGIYQGQVNTDLPHTRWPTFGKLAGFLAGAGVAAALLHFGANAPSSLSSNLVLGLGLLTAIRVAIDFLLYPFTPDHELRPSVQQIHLYLQAA